MTRLRSLEGLPKRIRKQIADKILPDTPIQEARSKYGNKKEEVNGIVFHSGEEAKRYEQLLFLEKAGDIKDLTLQPKFILQEAFNKDGVQYHKIKYIADFMYYDTSTGRAVVEDVKAWDKTLKKYVLTKEFIIKRKLFEKRYQDLKITLIGEE